VKNTREVIGNRKITDYTFIEKDSKTDFKLTASVSNLNNRVRGENGKPFSSLKAKASEVQNLREQMTCKEI
jgi:DNA polymerase III sliding clamp (beta) subunit (PCNA family)